MFFIIRFTFVLAFVINKVMNFTRYFFFLERFYNMYFNSSIEFCVGLTQIVTLQISGLVSFLNRHIAP